MTFKHVKKAILARFFVAFMMALLLILPTFPSPVFGWKYSTEGKSVVDVELSSDGNYIVGCTWRDVYFLDSSGNLIWKKSLSSEVYGASISGEGDYVVVGAGSNIYLLNNNGDELWKNDLDYTVHGVSISHSGEYVAAAASEIIYLYDKTGSLLWKHAWGEANNIILCQDDDFIGIAVIDNDIISFDVMGELLWTYDQIFGGPDSISATWDGEYIVAANVFGEIQILDRTGSLVRKSTLSTELLTNIAVSISTDSKYVAVAYCEALEDYSMIALLDEACLEIWSYTIPSQVNDISISSEGKLVVAGASDGYIHLLENLLPSTVTCIVSKPKIALGEAITVSGSVTPPRLNIVVYLTYTREINYPFHEILDEVTRNVTTNTEGFYIDTYIPSEVGYWTVAASTAGDEQYMGNNSLPVSFIVGGSTITCDLSQERVFAGKSITVSGQIDPPHENVEVELAFGSYQREIKTGSDGSYTTSFTPDSLGPWSVSAYWQGDHDHAGNRSSEASFTVDPVLMVGDSQIFRSWLGSGSVLLTYDTHLEACSPFLEYNIINVTIISWGGGIGNIYVYYNIKVLESAVPEAEGDIEATFEFGSGVTDFKPEFEVPFHVRVKAVAKYVPIVSIRQLLETIELKETQDIRGCIFPWGPPRQAGGNVNIVYEKPDGSSFSRTVTVESDGTFTDSLTPDSIGRWTVSASWPGDQTHSDAETSTSFFVKGHSNITLEVHVVTPNKPLVIGRDIRVFGEIYPQHAAVQVTLIYSAPNGTEIIRTVMSNFRGSYEEIFTPDLVGFWEVKASWEGDEDHVGAESSSFGESFYVLEGAPEFVISNLLINPSEAKPNEEVTISVNVENVGDLAGSCGVNLEIDGTIVSGRSIYLDAGESTIVSFEVSEEEEGTYEVRIGEEIGIMTVRIPPATISYEIIGVAVVIIIVIAIIALRRR